MPDFNLVVENAAHIKELTGLTHEEFNTLHIAVEEKILSTKVKLTGSPGKIKNKKVNLLIFLHYMRGHMIQRQMSIFFNISQPQICRIVNYYRKFVESVTKIENTIKDVSKSVIVDATEQLIERPKDNEVQKKYYSGKKKPTP
jgi:hypothetical protein